MGDELDGMIAALRRLGDMPEAAAREMGPALTRAIVENIRAQRGPDGAPWPASESGADVLVGAVAALRVEVTGATVLATLRGIHAAHHHGRVRGGRRRPILPDTVNSPTVLRAAAEALRRVTRGG